MIYFYLQNLNMTQEKNITGVVVGLLQIISISLFWIFFEYNHNADGGAVDDVSNFYDFYSGVSLMILVGFGFLYSGFENYEESGISLNFVLACFAIQWTVLFHNFWVCVFDNDFSNELYIDLKSMIVGNFGAGCILISYGVVIGHMSLFQLVLMSFIELFFYSLNEYICIELIHGVDMGGSVILHYFAALFGVIVSKICITKSFDIKTNKHSGLFAMIGTLILFIFWPSFNGAFATGNSQHRVIVNTFLSLTASSMGGVCFSLIFKKKMNFDVILNASIAGGVGIGSSADLVVGPGPSIMIGFVSGSIVACSFEYGNDYKPFVDVCNVYALHGLCGIIGALSGILSLFAIDTDKFGGEMKEMFFEFDNDTVDINTLVLRQVYMFLTTTGICVLSAIFCGYVLKWTTKNPIYFDDKHHFD